MSAFLLWLKEFFGGMFKKAPAKPQPPVDTVNPIKTKPIMIVCPKNAGEYEAKYKMARINAENINSVSSAAAKIKLHKDQYDAVEKATNVPWYAVACIHSLESGLDFGACLHNGEHIIGNGRKTTLVPAGRGPFETWHEAAVDAIKMNPRRWERINKNTSIGYILDAMEGYNGLGYRRRGLDSPYLWSMTTEQRTKGKYIADGVWDSNAVSKQCGAVAILKALGI